MVTNDHEPIGPRCMAPGCDKADAHAFLKLTEHGVVHLREATAEPESEEAK